MDVVQADVDLFTRDRDAWDNGYAVGYSRAGGVSPRIAAMEFAVRCRDSFGDSDQLLELARRILAFLEGA